MYSLHLLKLKRGENVNHKRWDAVAVQETEMEVLERESLTSL